METAMITIPIILVLGAAGWLLARLKGWQYRQMAFGLLIGLMCAGTAWGAGFSGAVESGTKNLGGAVGTAFADLTDGKDK
jgi:hypothetical protein